MFKLLAVVCIALCSVATSSPIPPEVKADPHGPIVPEIKNPFFLPKLPLPKLPFDKLPKDFPIKLPIGPENAGQFPIVPEIAAQFPMVEKVLKELVEDIKKEINTLKEIGLFEGPAFGKGLALGPLGKGPEIGLGPLPKLPGFPKGPGFGLEGLFPKGPEPPKEPGFGPGPLLPKVQ